MAPNSRRMPSLVAWRMAAALGILVALSAACMPGSGLPTQPQGTVSGSSDATSSSPTATASSGGSVVPVINF